MAQQIKRKKLVILIETKLEALKWLDTGESINKIVANLGVGEVTVRDWRRNRTKIEQWLTLKASASYDRKSIKSASKSEFKEVNDALFLWFVQQRKIECHCLNQFCKKQFQSIILRRKFVFGECWLIE